MIIDAHTHIGKVGRDNQDVTAADLLQSMEEASIDYSVVIAKDYYDPSTTTQNLLKECRDEKRLGVVASLHFGGDIPSQIEQLKTSLEEGDVLGVKFLAGYENYYPTDKKITPLYEYCQEHGFPVVFHTGVLAAGSQGILKQIHPLNVDEVANRFPDLKIVMAHLGNPWVVDCAAVVNKNPNVYADLSGFFPEYQSITMDEVNFFTKTIKDFTDFAGDLSKCLFGTDYPLYNQKEYLGAVQQLDMTDEGKERVFWQNAKEIFKIGV